MSTTFHRRVRSILEESMRCRTDERELRIRTAAGSDVQLLREVMSLLPHYLHAAGFADRSAASLLQPQESCPQRVVEPVNGDEPLEWRPPFMIYPYVVKTVVGMGGMGVVYRARHKTSGRQVAIKVLRRRMLARAIRRFRLEQELLREMRHPGIVKFLHSGEHEMRSGVKPGAMDRRPYFVMDYVDGKPLSIYAHEQGLDALQRVELMAAICEAVEFAHHRGVVHCDLKPSNILVDPSGRPQILDFGIARFADHDSQTPGGKRFVGTRRYASPEQIRGEWSCLTPASDVFSLGIITFELLTGRLPTFERGCVTLDLSHLRMNHGSAHNSGDDRGFQSALSAILRNALHGRRMYRYATAGEMGESLCEVCRVFKDCRQKVTPLWLRAIGRRVTQVPMMQARLLSALLRHRISTRISMF